VLAVEHCDHGRYSARDARLFDIFSDIVALTVDNARSFSRLRTLGADAERTRIARDLHDRLGQYLTFIAIELERIIADDGERTEPLGRLRDDVQQALEELRETLRQLRSSVNENRSLAVAAKELIDRFNRRGPTLASLTVTAPHRRLPVPIENELLRILQEALSNVAKHAGAANVVVTWAVREDRGVLTISDDGGGFDPASSVRDSAFGLVGMRERADLVGARLRISSEPGQGTTVTVTAGTAFELEPERPPQFGTGQTDVLVLDDHGGIDSDPDLALDGDLAALDGLALRHHDDGANGDTSRQAPSSDARAPRVSR
jgi:signal transduction histidine kinase